MAALNARSHSLPEIRLAELLSALSHALDMVEGQPAGHCVRCCWIGTQVGAEMGLEPKQIWELYYTLLLKDLGCSSNAARICQLYMVDDIAFKRDFHTINDSLPQVLRFVLSHTGMQAGLAERFRALVHIFQNGGQIAQELMETRCDRGAEIARKMRFSEAVAQAIRCFDEHWDGHGRPAGLSGEQIPIYARISLLAQIIDVFQTADGVEAAKREILHRTGTWFDPRAVAAFARIAALPGFWERLRSDDLQQAIFSLEPAQELTLVDEDYLDDIAAAFAQVVDSKSSFTSGHSALPTAGRAVARMALRRLLALDFRLARSCSLSLCADRRAAFESGRLLFFFAVVGPALTVVSYGVGFADGGSRGCADGSGSVNPIRTSLARARRRD